jgi:hypothetical protein
MRTLRVGAALLVVAAAAASCRNPAAVSPGLRVISGAGVVDTVGAFLPRALVVELRTQGGGSSGGIHVEFTAPTAVVNGVHHPTLLFAAAGTNAFQPIVQVPTDGSGRAAVRVAMGSAAGAATATIASATQGFSTTASFSVNPGAPAHLAIAPLDSAVYVDATYSLRTNLTDRFGNPLPVAAASYTVQGATVSATDGTVRGISVGRSSVTVSAAGVTRTANVSVVPRGTLLAAGSDGIYTFGLDGSGFRRVLAHPGARSPRWFPDGQSFVYSVGLSNAYVGTLAGATARLVPGSPLQAELWGHPSRDGTWVYFGGYSGGAFRGYPHRVRRDGTDLQLVPGFTPDNITQGHPSPAPDGNRLVYFREEGDSRSVFLRVLDMTTGAVQVSGISGHSPTWSHGDSIAYTYPHGSSTGPIRLMAANGSGIRQVTAGEFEFGLDWSPDDQWIVGRNAASGRIEVVVVATGARIPLPFTSSLRDPTWRP